MVRACLLILTTILSILPTFAGSDPDKRYPIPVFAGRNSQRLPDHHRLDLSLTYSGDKTRKFWGEWILSVYNVYNRKNIYSVSFVPAGKDQSTLQMEKNYLFPIIPAITYRLTY